VTIRSPEQGRANFLGAQASLPACFGQSAIAGNLAGKDACAPRKLALVCSLKAPFGATRSNAKKSATHKQIGVAEASSIYGWAVSWASFINRGGPKLIELINSSYSLLCLKYVIDLIDICLVTISSGSTPLKPT
jgi:hypothetical protein